MYFHWSLFSIWEIGWWWKKINKILTELLMNLPKERKKNRSREMFERKKYSKIYQMINNHNGIFLFFGCAPHDQHMQEEEENLVVLDFHFSSEIGHLSWFGPEESLLCVFSKNSCKISEKKILKPSHSCKFYSLPLRPISVILQMLFYKPKI